MARSLRRYRRELVADIRETIPDESHEIATRLAERVVAYVEIQSDRRRLFAVKVLHDGVTAIRYDLKAALAAAIALVGGVVGANLISAGAAVAGCLIALCGMRKPILTDVAHVLVALHQLGGNSTIVELSERLSELGHDMSTAQLRERIADLDNLGAIHSENELVSLKEWVLIKYHERRDKIIA